MVFKLLPRVLCRVEVWALRWPGKDMQFLLSSEVRDYLACVLRVIVLLQDERTTMSACRPRNEVIFKNVPKHISSHVTFSVHSNVQCTLYIVQSRKSPTDHVDKVTASMFHSWKIVVSVESLPKINVAPCHIRKAAKGFVEEERAERLNG